MTGKRSLLLRKASSHVVDSHSNRSLQKGGKSSPGQHQIRDEDDDSNSDDTNDDDDDEIGGGCIGEGFNQSKPFLCIHSQFE